MEQLSFVDTAGNRREYTRDSSGRFLASAFAPQGPAPASAEVATVQKAEFYSPISPYEYPNLSAIIRTRSQGQGIRFYDTMEGTDADLAAFFRGLVDDVLHYPYTIKAAGTDAAHLEHAALFKYGLESIPNKQSVFRHFLTAYARGFSVTERMYRVVDRGDWKGAVIYDALLDKPQRWFTFDTDRRLRFRTFHNYVPGELVDPDKFIVTIYGSTSNPFGEAMYDLCYWPWFLKHHALKNQALFMEKWASPTAKAEYEWSGSEKLNKENRTKALEVLQAIQSDQAIAVPKGMIVSLIESMRSGTVSFDTYVNQLTEMESRLVTGQLLASMGAAGGSHALGKVHERQAANKVTMLAGFLSHVISRYIGRDLIDRNYGPQDAYPVLKIVSIDPETRQAEVEVEAALMANGHKLSRAWSDETFMVVTPADAGDELTIPAGSQPAQPIAINPTLAAPIAVAMASLPAHRDLHAAAMGAAKTTRAHLDGVGSRAAKAARPAIKAAVKGLAKAVRKLKPGKVKKAHVYAGMKGIDVNNLGDVMGQMMGAQPVAPALAAADGAEPTPPAISDAAKLALALQMIAIADRISDAAGDAPPDMTGQDFSDSLTDPNGVAVDQAFANMFDGTHSTNIASIATANLRAKLADPKYRAANPYVMVVVTNPNARLAHRMMDGYILSAEEARYSPFLPPFDFGCDCQIVPISAASAKAAGLTGASPAGSLETFLNGKGARPVPGGGYGTPGGATFNPGAAPGFAPAFGGTDLQVQLQALRQKAEELRAEDPEAWASLNLWLAWLFSYDVLREDPPPEAAQEGN